MLVCDGGPSAEICDGVDNNCNGETDETFFNLGAGCSVGIGICQRTGLFACSTDGLAEVCDVVCTATSG